MANAAAAVARRKARVEDGSGSRDNTFPFNQQDFEQLGGGGSLPPHSLHELKLDLNRLKVSPMARRDEILAQ
ncbi:hypothetical protein EYF80_045889 [Liparis tanakae]|uniref:Uncharacterized protein n=1 Tax=Liparis tanakae TaxID=230148 RepID=A0A4Z2FRR1_9TELE|nr:hypothetical protein EYF80_045889 [Liparis tanakae]